MLKNRIIAIAIVVIMTLVLQLAAIAEQVNL
jgi:hypothetical protein